jgi:hypothetical protein
VAYALTSSMFGNTMAIVNFSTGEKFCFPVEDGAMIAGLFDEEYPPCEGCGYRDGVCGYCGYCSNCGSCEECEDVDDEEEVDDEG